MREFIDNNKRHRCLFEQIKKIFNKAENQVLSNSSQKPMMQTAEQSNANSSNHFNSQPQSQQLLADARLDDPVIKQNLALLDNAINDSYPDMLILLSADLIVQGLLLGQGFNPILVDKKFDGYNQPIEFLIEPNLSAQIRNSVENKNENESIQRFEFNLKRAKIVYEIRLIYLKSSTEIYCMIRDISDSIESRNKLKHMVMHDTLTGLPNRTLYYKTLNKIIGDIQNSDNICGVIFFDLDRFKSINDSLGHRVGDTLLISVANRLQKNLNENEFVARMSGDEFTVLVTNSCYESDIIEVAKRILSIFKSPFNLKNQLVEVKASIGVSIYPRHSLDADLLTQYADTAMYSAKEHGGNQINLFKENQISRVKKNFQIDQNLRKALKNNEIYMVYQPQFSIETGEISGLESLIRWLPENGTHVSPAVFIPIAELTGYINELGLWIINSVCQQIHDWKLKNIQFNKVSINLSRSQLIDSGIVDTIFSIMKYHDVVGQELMVEITEDSIIKNNEVAMYNLNRLKGVGIKIAIDDFGSGYSSFFDLKKFPFSQLKIDKSFIDEIGKFRNSDAIVRAIIAMGSELSMHIVAEGVETQLQYNFLKKHNCDIIQGFLLEKPLKVDEVEQLIQGDIYD